MELPWFLATDLVGTYLPNRVYAHLSISCKIKNFFTLLFQTNDSESLFEFISFGWQA